MAGLFPGAGVQIRIAETFGRRIIAWHNFPRRNYRLDRSACFILAICGLVHRHLSNRVGDDTIGIGADVLLRAVAAGGPIPLVSARRSATTRTPTREFLGRTRRVTAPRKILEAILTR